MKSITFVAFLWPLCAISFAVAGEVNMPATIKAQIETNVTIVKKTVPVSARHMEQNKQLFQTWVSGSTDLQKASKRESKRFNRTTYKEAISEEKLRLPTERLELTPLPVPVGPTATAPRGISGSRAAAADGPLYRPSLKLDTVPAIKLAEAIEVIYKEGPMYFNFQKMKEMKATMRLQDAEAIKITKEFLLGNKFLVETAKDKIGAIYVQNRHMNKEGQNGSNPEDYLIQQDVVFERIYDGQPVLNSKITVGFRPETREIILFKHFNWPSLEPTEVPFGSMQPAPTEALTPASVTARLEQKIKKYSGTFTKAAVEKVIPAWFQTAGGLLPVMAFDIKMEYPSPRGPLTRNYLEVINLAGSDDIFFEGAKSPEKPVKAPHR